MIVASRWNFAGDPVLYYYVFTPFRSLLLRLSYHAAFVDRLSCPDFEGPSYVVWLAANLHPYSAASAVNTIIATKCTCASVSLDVGRLMHI